MGKKGGGRVRVKQVGGPKMPAMNPQDLLADMVSILYKFVIISVIYLQSFSFCYYASSVPSTVYSKYLLKKWYIFRQKLIPILDFYSGRRVSTIAVTAGHQQYIFYEALVANCISHSSFYRHDRICSYHCLALFILQLHFIVKLIGETFSMSYKNFSAIYPNYLDSDKTVKMGRRIAAKDAVPEPTIQDLHEALKTLDIRHVIQPHKGYSRDASSRWDNPGRILIDLEGAVEQGVLQMSIDGGFDLSDIPEMGDNDESENNENKKDGGRGKKQLLRQLAQTMKGLPGRKVRLEAKNKQLEEEKLKAAKEEKAMAAAAKTKVQASGGGGNRKKKGKKKKG